MEAARTLSVIVPVYNEEETIARVLRKLLEVPYLEEVIVVDDCSTDRTVSIARALAEGGGGGGGNRKIRLLQHERNRGKTGALKTGFAASRGDIVIVQDADLEYDPAEIPDVIMPIVSGVADVVYGSRFLVKKAARVLYFYHYLANKSLTLLSNLLTNINLSDVATGYKAFRGEVIRNMILTSSGFGFEFEVTAKVAKLGCAIYEVPISYYGRTYEQGKKIGLPDAFAAVWYLLRYNCFCSLRSSYRKIPLQTRRWN